MMKPLPSFKADWPVDQVEIPEDTDLERWPSNVLSAALLFGGLFWGLLYFIFWALLRLY
jgi:hypothetical protein